MEAFLKVKKRLMDGIVDDDEFSVLILFPFVLPFWLLRIFCLNSLLLSFHTPANPLPHLCIASSVYSFII